jgi:hypothetical protein
MLIAVARGASAFFLVAEVSLAIASWWCAMRLGEMQCGPEPPQPHTGIQLLLVAPPVLAAIVAISLVRRAFVRRTGAAAVVALVATIAGCGLGAASVLFAALLAMSC